MVTNLSMLRILLDGDASTADRCSCLLRHCRSLRVYFHLATKYLVKDHCFCDLKRSRENKMQDSGLRFILNSNSEFDFRTWKSWKSKSKSSPSREKMTSVEPWYRGDGSNFLWAALKYTEFCIFEVAAESEDTLAQNASITNLSSSNVKRLGRFLTEFSISVRESDLINFSSFSSF